MSRRVRRPLAKSRTSGDRPKGAPPYRGSQAERSHVHRPAGKQIGKQTSGKQPARFLPSRAAKPQPIAPEPAKAAPEPPALPTKVQTVVVTADENNMRIDGFLEARFPGLSVSHF